MFYLVGLGLYDEKDVTVRGREVIKSCKRVYLESYTSILMVDKDRLERFYDRTIILADRDMVETDSDAILDGASEVDVALLVVGDPFGATTHTDIILRARSLSIPTHVIHNASVMNAIGACGLQLYNFGQTVSIPFWTDNWKPDSWLGRIRENYDLGLHTLLLLDIKVKEQSEENLARGRKMYEPPRFMSPATALKQLLAVLSSPSNEDEEPTKAAIPSSKNLAPTTTLALSLSRLGSPTQRIIAGTLDELSMLEESEFGEPLHAMIVVGKKLHPLEVDFAKIWAVGEGWLRVSRDVYGVDPNH